MQKMVYAYVIVRGDTHFTAFSARVRIFSLSGTSPPKFCQRRDGNSKDNSTKTQHFEYGQL